MSELNYLEKLLDGVEVEWTTIGEVFDLKNGYTPSKANTEYWTNGEVPWFRMEDIRTNGRILKAAIQSVSLSAVKGKLIPANSLIMSTTATLGEHALIEVPFLTNQQITSFSISGAFSGKVDIKFMFHYFFEFGKWCSENANKNGGMGIIGIAKLKQFQIPIPCPDNPKKSLEIQAEIVRILDAFTAMTAELTAELTARKKQYNYYRDKLLSFEEGEVEWKTVEEVFDLKNGYTPSKANAEYWTNGEVPWFRMEDIRTNGRILRAAIQRVSASAVKGKLIPPNSLIMSTTATIGEHALVEVPFLTNQQITSFTLSKDYEKKVNVKFMFYYFFIFGRWCSENSNKNGGMGIIGLSKLKQFEVPVPSLAEQARIVAILDKFDALTNSITEGLPREIELRQKQYAYYRDLLFNFPKPETASAARA